MLAFLAISFGLMFLLSGTAAAQGGRLVAAEYGAGNQRIDVTPQVRAFLHDGILQFDIHDRNLGVDPARNHVKELFIASVTGMEMWKSSAFRNKLTSTWSLTPMRVTNGTIANCISCAPTTAVQDIL